MDPIDNMVPLIEAVVSFMNEGVIIATEDGEVLYQNPAACEMLGMAVNEPISRLDQIGNFDLQSELQCAARSIGEWPRPEGLGFGSAGGFVRFERNVDAKGVNRTLEFHSGFVQVSSEGRPLRLVITQDRTEQRNLEALVSGAKNDFISGDPIMLQILDRVQKVAPTKASVLLQGATGTGKTALARLIHRMSDRADHPFIEVNCAAFPEALIESELFGHVKGAFTGAGQARIGRFQAADGGTLFLDEVGEIPLHLQAKLLRAILEQEFEMVGSDKPIQVDVRVISATNQPLRDMVDENRFRADLYYRLAVIPLNIPSLKERPTDIPLLLKHFCNNLVARGFPDDIDCTPEAMRLMMDYPWPGNVREMENAVQHAVICAVDKAVIPESLPQDIREYQPSAGVTGDDDLAALRQATLRALRNAGGNKSRAAQDLGIDRTTLWRRLKRFGIDPNQLETVE